MKIHEWSFAIVSKSPLRIGADDGDLLLDDNGRPFLPGTSWAGACRSYMVSMDKSNERLFGSQGEGGIQYPSLLIFSDGICETPQPFEVRPRIRLDKETRTVHREKFEQMVIAAGTRFKLKLMLRSDQESDKGVVETMLAALNRGYIRLGANKSTGGGKFEIVDGQYVEYDLSKRDDLEAYVEHSKASKEWSPDAKARFEVLDLTLSGNISTPLLIAGPYPHDSSKPDRSPVQASYDGEVYYIIPATSFKGALRHQTARIIRALSVDPGLEAHLFDGRIYLEDIVLDQPKTKVYHRVAIHPVTGGYKDGALVEEETVLGRFSTTILLKYSDQDTRDRAAAALLLFSIRDFATGRQTLGSGKGIGRGDLWLSELVMSCGDKSVTIDFAKRIIRDPARWLDELQEALDHCSKEEAG